MKAKVELELKPFLVPNFVIVKNADKNSNGIPLSMLDSETLLKMCDDFKDSVFGKAKKEHPPIAACNCQN